MSDGELFDAPPATAGTPAPAKKAAAKKAAAADKAPRGPGRPSNNDKLAAKVGELYTVAGMALVMVDADLAGRVVARSDDFGAAWVKLADENPKVRRALERITSTSTIGSVVALHAAVFGPTIADKLGLGALFFGTGAVDQGVTEATPEAPAYPQTVPAQP